MDPDDAEVFETNVPLVDDDSESEYEAPTEDHSSQDEEIPVSRATFQKGRSRSTSRNTQSRAPSHDSDEDLSPDEKKLRYVAQSKLDQQIREEALEWAANFQAPESAADIHSPTRHPSRSRSKRKAAKPPSQVRAKRLKSFYNDEYRELLNEEIGDAASRAIPEDEVPTLNESQIGCSVWTAKEKDVFFSALSRLGRDDVKMIAERVGSKSELEVQEYIHVLHQGLREYIERGGRQLLLFTDQPAAMEISDECCGVLERAGDALNVRQQLYEEKGEAERWGDSWLLNADVDKWIQQRQKSEEGEEEIEELLPAANLFNLKNWLELSQRIFMNPGVPREDDNWHALAEENETPAIRATAFEDFHSLAVNITKRIISTTLFCTMSRRRAMSLKKVKHADVNRDDVDAALKILGLKANSNEFWVGCARRCNLVVIDDENGLRLEDGVEMTYEEVEHAFGKESIIYSRSESASQTEQSGQFSSLDERIDSEDITDSDPEDPYSSNGTIPSEYSIDDDAQPLEYTSDTFAAPNKRHEASRQKRIEARRAKYRAEEKYTEAVDIEANQLEEERLWSLLRQTAPFEIKHEQSEIPGRPKGRRNEDVEDWREKVEFWNHWEVAEEPVPEESFVRNRVVRSRRSRKRGRGLRRVGGREGELESDDNDELEVEGLDTHVDDEDGGDEDEEQAEAGEGNEWRKYLVRSNEDEEAENDEEGGPETQIDEGEDLEVDDEGEGNEGINYEDQFEEEPNSEDEFPSDPDGCIARQRARRSFTPHYPAQAEQGTGSEDEAGHEGEVNIDEEEVEEFPSDPDEYLALQSARRSSTPHHVPRARADADSDDEIVIKNEHED